MIDQELRCCARGEKCRAVSPWQPPDQFLYSDRSNRFLRNCLTCRTATAASKAKFKEWLYAENTPAKPIEKNSNRYIPDDYAEVLRQWQLLLIIRRDGWPGTRDIT